MVTVTLDLTEHGYVFNVRVKSLMRSHLFAKASVNPSDHHNAAEIQRAVGTAAVECALWLESRHGDSFNLNDLLRETTNAFTECVVSAAETPRSVDGKLKKLMSDTSTLSNEQLEVVKRVKFLIDRGMTLPTRLHDAFQAVWVTVSGVKPATVSVD